jgi:hypothetical protein
MKRICIIALCLLVLPALVIGCTASEPESTGTPAPPTPTPTPGPVSYTTGLAGSDLYRPVAVSIDNSSAARPQSGLQSADIVYEVEAEGGIPRFIAIFNDTMPDRVGPIRSARVYFLDIVKEYDALLVHVGGPRVRNSSNVYAAFSQLDIQHIDGEGQYIWRDHSRSAPHNCYTDVAADRTAYAYEPEPRTFLYSDDGPASAAESGTRLSVSYNSGAYRAVYTYDEALGAYLCSYGATALNDANTGEQVRVKNVIVQFARHYKLDSQHINIDLTGTGDAYILSGGRLVRGTWERDSISQRTVFNDAEGNEITFKPGNTWINVVRPSRDVTVE